MNVGAMVARLSTSGQYLDRVYGFCVVSPVHATPLTVAQAVGLRDIFGSDIALVMWCGEGIGWQPVPFAVA